MQLRKHYKKCGDIVLIKIKRSNIAKRVNKVL